MKMLKSLPKDLRILVCLEFGGLKPEFLLAFPELVELVAEKNLYNAKMLKDVVRFGDLGVLEAVKNCGIPHSHLVRVSSSCRHMDVFKWFLREFPKHRRLIIQFAVFGHFWNLKTDLSLCFSPSELRPEAFENTTFPKQLRINETNIRIFSSDTDFWKTVIGKRLVCHKVITKLSIVGVEEFSVLKKLGYSNESILRLAEVEEAVLDEIVSSQAGGLLRWNVSPRMAAMILKKYSFTRRVDFNSLVRSCCAGDEWKTIVSCVPGALLLNIFENLMSFGKIDEAWEFYEKHDLDVPRARELSIHLNSLKFAKEPSEIFPCSVSNSTQIASAVSQNKNSRLVKFFVDNHKEDFANLQCLLNIAQNRHINIVSDLLSSFPDLQRYLYTNDITIHRITMLKAWKTLYDARVFHPSRMRSPFSVRNVKNVGVPLLEECGMRIPPENLYHCILNEIFLPEADRDHIFDIIRVYKVSYGGNALYKDAKKYMPYVRVLEIKRAFRRNLLDEDQLMLEDLNARFHKTCKSKSSVWKKFLSKIRI